MTVGRFSAPGTNHPDLSPQDQAELDRRPNIAECSDLNQSERGVQAAEIHGVGRHDRLTSATSAEHHVGVDHVRRSRRREQPPDSDGIVPIKSDDLGTRIANEPREPGLSSGIADRLGERGGWNGDSRGGLRSPRQQHDDASVVTVERDHRSGIQGDPRTHAAERFRGRFVDATPSASSAHARSSGVNRPPVSSNAAASMAPQPVMSWSESAIACRTKPDTLAACPEATSFLIAASSSSGIVTVIFVVAIPITILPADRPRISPNPLCGGPKYRRSASSSNSPGATPSSAAARCRTESNSSSTSSVACLRRQRP